MNAELRRMNDQVRRQLRRFGVVLPKGKPDFALVRRRWHLLDYACSYYDSQGISIKLGGQLWLVRHEYGHFLVDYFDLQELDLYDRYFAGGWDGLEYNIMVPVARAMDTVLRKWAKLKPPKGLASYYALLGGEEDFCECLALMLKHRGGIEAASGGDESLREKLVAVRRLLARHCKKPR